MLKALGDFLADKAVTSQCPFCKSILVVNKLGESTWSIKCECGKCNDTLRGF
jgi:hypothetical protein